MKAQVIGLGQRRSGTAKKTGKPYDGTSVYIMSAASDVQGHKAGEIYLNHLSSVPYPEINVGDIIDIDRNEAGFIEEITVVKPVKS
ncbi:MAG: hypothetical protein LBI19_02925 [Oscillospiraceae bacterium]|jgi:hypothetical protein|nr:hypothetical protein [Oscillospiraceae bacterium]